MPPLSIICAANGSSCRGESILDQTTLQRLQELANQLAQRLGIADRVTADGVISDRTAELITLIALAVQRNPLGSWWTTTPREVAQRALELTTLLEQELRSPAPAQGRRPAAAEAPHAGPQIVLAPPPPLVQTPPAPQLPTGPQTSAMPGFVPKSAGPYLAAAFGLLILGGAAVLLLRKKRPDALQGTDDDDADDDEELPPVRARSMREVMDLIDEPELIALWGLSRTAASGKATGTHARRIWVAQEYAKAHPEVGSSTDVYKAMERLHIGELTLPPDTRRRPSSEGKGDDELAYIGQARPIAVRVPDKKVATLRPNDVAVPARGRAATLLVFNAAKGRWVGWIDTRDVGYEDARAWSKGTAWSEDHVPASLATILRR